MIANLSAAVLLRRAAILVLVCGFSSPLLAAAVDTAEDLAAVIALHGRPCGKVVDFKKHGENDYVARCATGDVYRVSVDAAGRVRVEKQS